MWEVSGEGLMFNYWDQGRDNRDGTTVRLSVRTAPGNFCLLSQLGLDFKLQRF